MKNRIGLGKKALNLNKVTAQPIRKGQYEEVLMKVDPVVYPESPLNNINHSAEYGEK